MTTIYGNSYVDPRNVNLKGGASGSGLIRWSVSDNGITNAGNWASNPFATTEIGLYINSSNQLVFSSLGSATILGAAGGGSGTIPTWEQIFALDTTFETAGTTFSITEATTSATNNVVTITVSDSGSSGAGIAFSQAGSGADILGTSSTWSVSKAGVGTFASLVAASVTGASTTLTLQAASGANAVIIGSGSNTATIAVAATFSSTLTVTDGLVTINKTANATGILFTSSATTAGVSGASTGTVVFRSSTLTSGTLLKLQLTESTVSTNGGLYLNCYDAGTTASMFTIGRYGTTVITGNAYATAAFTVTAGDVVVSAGKINHTAVGATTTNGYTGTFNGLTTGVGMSLVHTTSVIAAGGSILRVSSTGIDTSTTTGCLVDLVSTNSTAGTQILATFSGLATGIGMSMVLAALTTGQGVNIAHSTSTIADGGSLIAISSSAANTGGATNGTMLDIKGTGQLTGTMVRLDTIQTTGTAMSVISTGIMLTTGNLLTLTANSATTAAGLFRVNGNGLSDGIGIIVASSSTALTSTGRLFKVSHTGTSTAAGAGIIAGVTSAANDATTVFKVTTSGTSIAGKVVAISAAAMTTGTGIDMTDLAALTTGVGISIAHGTSAIGDGGSLIRLASTGINTGGSTNGTMLDIATTNQIAGTMIKVASALTTGTAMIVSSSAAMTTTGNLLTLTANSATTAAGILRVNANALTDGIGMVITSSSTALTSTGRLLSVNHTGNAGVSTIIAEIASAAADETVVFQAKASDALALGTIANISGALMTTGTALGITNLDALTTGYGINLTSNSADTSSRSLMYIHNDNTAAVGTTPLTIVQDAILSEGTTFKKVANFAGVTLYVCTDGTSPNTVLTGVAGDICLNGTGGATFYCSSAGKNWSAL